MTTHSESIPDSMDSLVAQLADEFVARSQRGESPSVEDYVRQHPELADTLRQVLPAVRLMNQPPLSDGFKPAPRHEDLSGTLGDYQLLREIGRGGMGVVYEAEQISLSRRVALKTLPFAAAMDPRRLERFKNEAQAAAQLHHGNIVPVYAVGSERGVWYYAMQMIQGRSLAEVISELRRWNLPSKRQGAMSSVSSRVRTVLDRSDVTPAEEFGPIEDSAQPVAAETIAVAAADTKEFTGLRTTSSNQDSEFLSTAVDLAIQAADALEHAHELDIVHRDIKPGNLMIDERGHLWVTDFGLARFRDDANVTATGDVIGTLSYMSPEQASGRRGAVDQRTDIYSLGATLYELVTLQPVFSEDNRAALFRRIVSDEPTAPRKLNPAIPIDLETIILKAMSRDSGTRYSTAQELADDLRRYRDNRPIKARRPTLYERVNKWARRHKPLVASAAVFMMLLVMGSVASTILLLQEKEKTEAALRKEATQRTEVERLLQVTEDERRQADENLELAIQNSEQARQILDSFIHVATDELARVPELQETRSRLLQESLTYYQSFIDQAQDNPPLKEELARSHQRLAGILHSMGSTPAAQAAIEQALLTQERLVLDAPKNKELFNRLSEMHFDLGVLTDSRAVKIVQNRDAQVEIDATDEQVERIEALWQTYRGSHEKNMCEACDPTEWRMAAHDAASDAIHKLQRILDDKQFSRLLQIELQCRGADMLNDPIVANNLGLTQVQRLQISRMEDVSKRICFLANGERICMTVRDQQVRKFRLLTPKQRLKLRALLGEPSVMMHRALRVIFPEQTNALSLWDHLEQFPG